jgi:iron complex outermembrane receptor protein
MHEFPPSFPIAAGAVTLSLRSELRPVACAVMGLCLGLGAAPSWAQTPARVSDLGQVEIRSNRDNDTEVRRESTAAKIVIGREEIEKQGDATLGEVLKRMPGVTIQGAPGRGGAIRMRGLGGGYTQILMDGERVPPGFSIDSLTPEQVERIEILRAPTAETGARAIAGTINIVLREGQRSNPDDFKLTRSMDHGQASEQVNWVHNLRTEPISGTVTLSLMDNRRAEETDTHTEAHSQLSPASARDRHYEALSQRQGVHANARLQWRGEQGKSLTLMPFLMYSEFGNHGQVGLNQTDRVGTEQASQRSDAAQIQSQSRFAMARLNGNWTQRLSADDRLEARFGVGRSQYDYRLDQTLLGTGSGLLLNQFETQNFNDKSYNLSSKWTRVMESGHQMVSGLELEGVTRVEQANAAVSEDGGDLQARTRRWAVYSQDEWKINPNWSAHGGLRYESILTEGSNEQGFHRNQSSVWTPLLHALWKPDPASRDQIRMSLTRSYKTPTLYNLVARAVPSRELNSPTRPDRVGNPDLRPELATGIDLAAERYLAGGGVLSANVFHRNISDLIRYVTVQQANPSWAPGQTRWVSTPKNVGDAVTEGLELEAKFRLDQLWQAALPVDIRSNMSFFRSRVKDVPGPNNRLDQQPSMTANFGGDYRVRAVPLTLGGNVNYNPDYETRRTEQQWVYQGMKRVVDVYGLWRVTPQTGLRVTLSNLLPRDYMTGNTYNGNGFYEQDSTRIRNWRILQLRLEMKI